jgi:succinyl-CoA synthetase beta subunit
MNLLEVDGKRLLRNAGLSVPGGQHLVREGETLAVDRPVVVKAQLPAGGRGKVGLVRLAEAGEAAGAAAAVLASLKQQGRQPLVLVEEQVAFAAEHYLALTLDDVGQQLLLMFALKGGVDVEDAPDAVRKLRLDPSRPVHPHELISFFREAGVSGKALGSIARFAAALPRLFRENDATLIEINPLAVTAAGQVVALDCKMSLDEYASPRHRDWQSWLSAGFAEAGLSELEVRARRSGFTFIEMEGDVAIISGGAGLGMMLVDLFAESGHRAANFCDLLGGSGEREFREMVDLVLERAAKPDVKAIAVYFTLSATSLKAAVMSVVNAIRSRPPAKPLVVGFDAAGPAENEMTMAQAIETFAALGHVCVADPAALVAAVDEALKNRAGAERLAVDKGG